MSRLSVARIASLVLVLSLWGPRAALAQADPASRRHADEIAELLAPGADLGRFAGEDALFLFAGDYIILHDDGRIDRGVHRVIRLNTALAVDEFSDPRVPYDTLRQELVVHACRTYTLDGRIVPSDDHAFSRVTPDAVAACARELHHQEMVLTLLGVERGCVIEYDVEVRDKVPSAPWLEGIAFFRLNYPVLRRVVTIKCPAGEALQTQVVGDAGADIAEQTIDAETPSGPDGPARIHVWRAESIPAAREADDGAGGRRTRAHLLYTTCRSWEDLAIRVLDDMVSAADFTETMMEWLDEQRRKPDCLTEEDLWRSILAHTSRLVRDVSIAPFEGYRAARPAPQVLATGCGDAWDKAALALTLADGAGLWAEICLRAAGHEPQTAIPALTQFDGILLHGGAYDLHGGAYDLHGGDYDLHGGPYDAADDAALYGDPLSGELYRQPQAWGGQPLFVLSRTEGRPSGWTGRDAPDVRAGRADVDVGLVVEPDGKVSGDLALSLAGVLCPAEEIADPQAFAKDYAGRLVAGAEVTGISVTRIAGTRAELRLKCTAPGLGEARGEYRYLTLSDAPRGVAELAAGRELERPERTTSLVLPGTLRERVRYRLLLPEGAAVTHAPRDASLRTGVGTWRASTHLTEIPPADRVDGARWILEIEREIAIDREEIEPASYGDFRRLMQAHQGEAGRMVIIRMGE